MCAACAAFWRLVVRSCWSRSARFVRTWYVCQFAWSMTSATAWMYSSGTASWKRSLILLTNTVFGVLHRRGSMSFSGTVKVLSRMFRGKFCAGLKRLDRRQQLRCTGPASALADPRQFRRLLRRLHRQDWVVYAKPAFGGPKKVLRYLGRYTHRIAISNHRLLAFDGERVTFRWKDYAHGGKQRTMTLLGIEFLRRFFLHVLPKGFVRIRYFGFLANRFRAHRLLLCQQLLASDRPPPSTSPETTSHLALPQLRRRDGCHPQTHRWGTIAVLLLRYLLMLRTTTDHRRARRAPTDLCACHSPNHFLPAFRTSVSSTSH